MISHSIIAVDSQPAPAIRHAGRTLIKQKVVPLYDASLYKSERIFVRTADGRDVRPPLTHCTHARMRARTPDARVGGAGARVAGLSLRPLPCGHRPARTHARTHTRAHAHTRTCTHAHMHTVGTHAHIHADAHTHARVHQT